jgi:hypothetical protein
MLQLDIFSLRASEVQIYALGSALVLSLGCWYSTLLIPLLKFLGGNFYLRWAFLFYGAPMISEEYEKVR